MRKLMLAAAILAATSIPALSADHERNWLDDWISASNNFYQGKSGPLFIYRFTDGTIIKDDGSPRKEQRKRCLEGIPMGMSKAERGILVDHCLAVFGP